MNPHPRKLTDAQRQQRLADLHRETAETRQGYRSRAMALFPHLCARCGRELSGKRIRELTVHHKDHDHTNNPPDGSNWELLCVYCHDHEHEKYLMAGHGGSGVEKLAPATFNPFANLDALIPPPENTGPG